MNWETVVGLEVHTELKTKTKLFCGCPNAFGSEPNTTVCPVCLGLPGTLPVLNAKAVEIAARVGVALGSEVTSSQFHRKNYFYPDMPKDYQISQYDVPINRGGAVTLPDGVRIGIERAHLEEDTGKLIHKGGGGRIGGATASIVDYNRSGVPLLEIVSRPDMRSGEQARAYVAELRAILVALGASDGRMEEGSLRVDANVSVRPVGSEELRTRCEIKNLNSLRSVARAISYEAERQIACYMADELVAQETRFWDEQGGVTGTLRRKEDADDYRYFPEPDLPPLLISDDYVAHIVATMPELPSARRGKLREWLGDAALDDNVSSVIEEDLWVYVTEAVGAGIPPRLAVNRAANELAALRGSEAVLAPAQFVDLCAREASGSLGASQVKLVLRALSEGAPSVDDVIEKLGLAGDAAEQIERVIASVIGSQPGEWQRFVKGDPKVGGFLLGKVMRELGGRVSGKDVKEALDRRAREVNEGG